MGAFGGIGSQGIASAGARLRGGIDAALPAGLFRAGLPPRRVRVLTLAALPPDPAATALLAAAGRDGRPFDVALAPSLFLRKSVAIPAAARRDAEAAIALQMRQSLPAGAAGLLWRSRPVGTRAGKADYEVFVLKQDSLTALLRACPAEPRRVVVADRAELAPLIDNRRRADRPQWVWNRAAPILAGLVLLAVLGAQAWRLAEMNAAERALRAEIAALGDRAAAARAEAEARDSAAAARIRDEARLVSESGRLAQLSGLTQALDDGVWISSLAVDGRTWRLTGFARSDISAVIAALQALPWVASVAPEGSIVLDSSTGESRFQLTIEAAAPAGLE
ncbi:PilN domain-containing protein [Rubellimicrobium aerolatum]|uniref:PilN domain-containing protein n=1 Tax=Rubellimicrobium aerolatum TaxID=490979 RepID=A0ABW0SCI1_9RHOB|nr:PilN domain-containing protein [Rubellimicrobium aerolatum]MBP1806172.1 Tfp pilus assembly protein PilN [Rubellimicrobium aerolatum]